MSEPVQVMLGITIDQSMVDKLKRERQAMRPDAVSAVITDAILGRYEELHGGTDSNVVPGPWQS